MICTPHRILFGWSNQGWWDGRSVRHIIININIYFLS